MSQKNLLDRYRPNVGVILFNRDGRVLYGRRAGDFADLDDQLNRFRWQMPQGGVDNGEEIVAAAFRELKEETGVTSAQLLMVTPGWLAYDFPPGYGKKNWKGQRQKWAAMIFEGEESEINLEADDHQEFDKWRWGELEEAPSLIVPFKRKIYAQLVNAFTPLRNFLRNTDASRASNRFSQS